MAGDKYLYHNAGRPTEKAAIQTSAGAGDAGKIPALDTTGKIDTSMMPVGVGADTHIMTTSENLAAGDWVNIYSNTGTLTARKADGTTNGKPCHGFVLAASTSGGNATVYCDGTNTQVSGRTVGAQQYLHTTAGAGVETAPSATGNLVQALGIALSATSVRFQPQEIATLV